MQAWEYQSYFEIIETVEESEIEDRVPDLLAQISAGKIAAEKLQALKKQQVSEAEKEVNVLFCLLDTLSHFFQGGTVAIQVAKIHESIERLRELDPYFMQGITSAKYKNVLDGFEYADFWRGGISAFQPERTLAEVMEKLLYVRSGSPFRNSIHSKK